jgi:hypothetical protein
MAAGAVGIDDTRPCSKQSKAMIALVSRIAINARSAWLFLTRVDWKSPGRLEIDVG